MSTPAIIEVKTENSGESVEIYRHWDGYPEAVIPELYGVWETLNKTHSHRDLSYVAADILFLWKLKDFVRDCPREENFKECIHGLSQPGFLLGYGIVPLLGYGIVPNNSRWSADYKYEVTIPNVGVSTTGNKWKVKVIRRDGAVLYEGALTENYEGGA